MRKHTPTTVSLSAWSVLRIVAILVGLWFLWEIRGALVILFIALLLAALIDPLATWLQKRRIPRAAGVVIVYLGLLAVLTGVLFLVVPPLVQQFDQFASTGDGLALRLDALSQTLDGLAQRLAPYGLSENFLQATSGLQETLSRGVASSFAAVTGFFGGVTAVSLVLVMTFYIVIEEDAAKRLFRHITPKRYQPYLVGLANRAQEKLGYWLRGQLALMAFVGVLTYVALLLLDVEYPLVLGVFAGFAELVPYAGPIVAAIPAVIIAFVHSPVKALIVLLSYYLIQQVENNVLVPKIMQRSVGLNPVVSLMLLLIGFESAHLFGIPDFLGAILAIPVGTVLSVIARDVMAYYESSDR